LVALSEDRARRRNVLSGEESSRQNANLILEHMLLVECVRSAKERPLLLDGPAASASYLDAGPSFFLYYLDIRSRTAVAFFDDYLIPVSPFASDRHIHIGRPLGTLFITEGPTILIADPLCACGIDRILGTPRYPPS
jgi:hypothetical protein